MNLWLEAAGVGAGSAAAWLRPLWSQVDEGAGSGEAADQLVRPVPCSS
jgi:hypothetical protein